MAEVDLPDNPKPELSTSAAVALVAGATYLSLGAGLLRGILYTRALSPTSRGVIQIVFLFEQYLCYSHLGIANGLVKHIPALLGRREEKQVEHLEQAGTTAMFLLTVVAAGVMWGVAIPGFGFGAMTRVALAAGGVHLIVSQLAGAYRIILRSHHQFSLIARSTLIEAVVLFVLIVAGAQLLDAPGAVIGWTLGMAVSCLYLLSSRAFPSRVVLDRRASVQLARIGLPMLGVSLADVFLRTADNIVVGWMLGTQALGYYSLAWQLAGYLYNVPGAAALVIMPKILRSYSEGGSQALRRSIIDMTSAFAILMPPLCGIAAIAGPILVRLILPRYVPAIGALQVFMISIVFLATPQALRTVLIAKNREIELIIWQTLGGLLIGGSVALLIRQGAGLTQLALAGAVGLFLASLAITWRGLQALELGSREILRYLLGLGAPLAYCAGLLWLLKTVLPRWLGLFSPLQSDIAALPIFIVLAAPLLWVAERQTRIISKLRARGGAPPPSSEETIESLPPDGGERGA